MLRNYFKIALRSLIKQKVYTTINVLGLSIGIASCLLITLFVSHEFSYDKFHNNSQNIYKIALERKYPNHITNYAVIPHSFADVMRRDFPEVSAVLKIGGPINNVIVSYKNDRDEVKRFEENFILAADSNFFEFFTFKLIKGDSKKSLSNINDVIVTEETARRYFGNDEPLGKVIRIFNRDFTVTGVCENVPTQSHIKFDFLTKWDEEFFANGLEVNFTTFTAHVYLQLFPGSDAKMLEDKFPAMVDTYASAQIEQDLGKSWEDYKKEGNGYRYFLQPLTSIHLDPLNIEAEMLPGGNLNYVYFLTCIAALIIAIACINFMNLATARSAERAREVGVRKTMGSLKSQLVSQFLVESVLLSVFATLIAVVLAEITLPYFNSLSNKQLDFTFSPVVVLGLLTVAVVVGFMAGSYPAFALSSFNPILIMKGNFSANAKGVWLRNGLVVFQFFISMVLIVGTLTVGKQMQYMQNKSLGYDKEKVLVVERVFALDNKSQTFIDELKRLPGVRNAAGSFSLLGRQGDFFGAQFLPEGSSEILTTKTMVIDDDFAATIGFEFVEGKGYSNETNDSLSIILNESAVKTMGLTDPVGKKVNQIQRGPNGNVTVSYTIMGVIKDFNFQSLRDPITPLTIQSTESFGGAAGYVIARIQTENVNAVITAVEAKWKELAPEQPFKFVFLDENLNAQYANEKKASQLFGIFSALAIIIACIGLFGLAAYTANLRTKEIGVRKVMGASIASVVILLTKDFTKLILMAFILSVPLSYYVMDLWLEGFAYRIEMGPGVFIAAGLITLFISWITVSYQSIKAAIVNPIKSLRSE
ncbi:ABC transporter permease [Chryseolinea sp. H1M3-3]|uniref:ABC transporter permease n=1 Tax=Chryseolinea sp. H1M3-3 TaxID=3034144 RepID=UPI0023EA7E78|nr:ABC transporter permease [Chryseolinea sp. H1M3-3]